MKNFNKMVNWDITRKCRLDCLHCLTNDFYKSQGDVVDMSTEQVFDAMRMLRDYGVERIHFLGGEPFERHDILEIIEYGCKLGIKMSVNTNGILLDDERISRIIKAGLAAINFSLDGAKAETHDKIRGKGTYEKLIENVKLFIKHNNAWEKDVVVRIFTVLVNLNVDEIDQIVELCCQLGVDCLIVGRLIDVGNAKLNKNELEVDTETIFAAAQSLLSKTVEHPELDIHINFLKPKIVEYFNLKNNANVQIHYSACHSITTTAYIQSDGTVLPCACLLTDGNADLASDMLRDSKRITEYSIDGIWESASFNDMVATIRNRKIYDNYTPCNMCKFNKRACNPCPMVNLSKQSVSMDLCQVAEKALATL